MFNGPWIDAEIYRFLIIKRNILQTEYKSPRVRIYYVDPNRIRQDLKALKDSGFLEENGECTEKLKPLIDSEKCSLIREIYKLLFYKNPKAKK